MGWTAIKEVVNNTGQDGYLYSQEMDHGYKIPAGGGTWTVDIWIPWARSYDEFQGHRIFFNKSPAPAVLYLAGRPTR